jgi:hypothetical protein
MDAEIRRIALATGLTFTLACAGDDGGATGSTSSSATSSTTTSTVGSATAGTSEDPSTSDHVTTSATSMSSATTGESDGEPTETGSETTDSGETDTETVDCNVDLLDEMIVLDTETYGQMTHINFAQDRRYIVYHEPNWDVGRVARRDVCGGDYTVLLEYPSRQDVYPRIVGDYLYIAHSTNFDDAGIVRYLIDDQANIIGDAEVIITPWAVHEFDASESGRYVIYTQSGSGVFLRDLETNTTVTHDAFSMRNDIDPVGQRVLSHQGNELLVYTIASEVTESYAIGGDYSLSGAIWLSDGDRVLFAVDSEGLNDEFGIYSLQSGLTTMIPVQGGPFLRGHYLAIDPSETRIAFTDLNGDDLHIMDLP